MYYCASGPAEMNILGLLRNLSSHNYYFIYHYGLRRLLKTADLAVESIVLVILPNE